MKAGMGKLRLSDFWRFRVAGAARDVREACGDSLTLLAVNLYVYFRHPLWMAKTAYRQRALPNIAVPKRFREKRIWRRIFDQNPLWQLFGCKMAAKEWMLQHAPGLHASRTLWSVKSVSELRHGALQAGIVLKADSGWNQNLFLDRQPLDFTSIKSLVGDWLRAPQAERFGARYWPDTMQQVFAEELIFDPDCPLVDINFFCCNGVVHFSVATVGEKTDQELIAYFTKDGERITSIMHETGYQRGWLPFDFKLPTGYAEAVECAANLSVGIDFIRVDIMLANGQPYACEMSPFPGEGGYDTTVLYKNWVKNWDIRRTWFISQPKLGLMEPYRLALCRRLAAS